MPWTFGFFSAFLSHADIVSWLVGVNHEWSCMRERGGERSPRGRAYRGRKRERERGSGCLNWFIPSCVEQEWKRERQTCLLVDSAAAAVGGRKKPARRSAMRFLNAAWRRSRYSVVCSGRRPRRARCVWFVNGHDKQHGPKRRIKKRECIVSFSTTPLPHMVHTSHSL